MQYFTLSWKKLHVYTFRLAQKIKKSRQDFDLVVAIARGGLSIGHILSDFLKLPVASFTVVSYKDFKQEKIPEVTFKLGNKLTNKNIILVDDVSDSGKTFIRGIDYLKGLGAKNIKTASPFIKPWTKFIPDFYVKSIDQWIVFPYDMEETIDALKRNYQKEKLTEKQIKNRLDKIGLPSIWIKKFVA